MALHSSEKVGATATDQERETLLQEVSVLLEVPEAFGAGKPDAVALEKLLREFRLEDSGALKPQPVAKL